MAFAVSLPQLAVFLPVLTLLYLTSKIVYNVFFHPLAKFNGPWLAKISNAWYGLSWCSGRHIEDIFAMHEKYGDVVRTAPNELSFATLESYKEIYGHATKDRRPFLKSMWYHIHDNNNEGVGIGNERDPQKHAAVRKSLSHGFSVKALRLQTDIVCEYVDLFVSQLNKYGMQESGVPIQEWYNWVTFDVIGNLAFGESFGATAEAKPSFWINTILEGNHANSVAEIMTRLPILKPLAFWLFRDLIRVRKVFMELSLQKARGRMAQENSRDDFFSHILSDKSSRVTEGYLCQQAQTFIVAGSETTSTFLTGVTWYLNQNLTAKGRLEDEVRKAFKESSEIDSDSTAHLLYLSAVIEEGLRIYNPAPFGLPRICPGAEINGHFIPAGTIVHTSPWATQHAKKYWHDPDGFHPERWLNAEHEYYNPIFDNDIKSASQPFSVGPRACIGKNLAYMEMRVILSKLVWHFNMELASKDMDWWKENNFYSLWKKPQLMVKFHPVA